MKIKLFIETMRFLFSKTKQNKSIKTDNTSEEDASVNTPTDNDFYLVSPETKPMQEQEHYIEEDTFVDTNDTEDIGYTENIDNNSSCEDSNLDLFSLTFPVATENVFETTYVPDPKSIPISDLNEKSNALKQRIPIKKTPLEVVIENCEYDNDNDCDERVPLLSSKPCYNSISTTSPIDLCAMEERVNSPLRIMMKTLKNMFTNCFKVKQEKEISLSDYCKGTLIDESTEYRTYEVLSPCKTKPINITFYYNTIYGYKCGVISVKIFNQWFSRDFFKRNDIHIERINEEPLDIPNPNNRMEYDDINEMWKHIQLPITPHDGLIMNVGEMVRLEWKPFDMYLLHYILDHI